MATPSNNNGWNKPQRHWVLDYIIDTIGWPKDEDDRPDLTALQALNLPPGTKPSTLNLLSISVSGFYKAQMPLMAAALAYRTIFGLVPVLIIALSMLGAFASEKGIKEVVDSSLRYSGLAEVFQIEQKPGGDSGAAPQPTQQLPTQQKPPEGDAGDKPVVTGPVIQREKLDEWVKSLSGGVKSISFTGIGIASLLLLIYAAVSMVVEIEYAFNRIYEAPAGKSWSRRIMQYWTLMTLGALFLVGTFYIGNQINAWVQSGIERNVTGEVASALLKLAGLSIQIGITGVILMVIYFTVPNARVRFLPAAVGALFAAVLWELLKFGFRWYVLQVSQPTSSYSRFYGSLALLPLTLFLIYCTWLIILFGLQIARSIQLFGRLRSLGPNLFALAAARGPSEPAIIDSGVVIPIMVGIAKNFEMGKPTCAADLKGEVRLHESVLREVLRQLARSGLLLQVASQSTGTPASILLPGIPTQGDEFFTLARGASAIPVEQLLTIGYTISDGVKALDPESEKSLPPALARLRAAQREAAKGMTLADLIQPAAPDVAAVQAAAGSAATPNPA
ncbi:MAG: YihY family inner membrane protein [Phycisphaerales bacterium]|nr:YihY family inner membrane protein [Phycisphaerales bacterium]